MEPLKKAQVEGFLMYAEPEVLFGNLDELCSVSNLFIVIMNVNSKVSKTILLSSNIFNEIKSFCYVIGNSFFLQRVSPYNALPHQSRR